MRRAFTLGAAVCGLAGLAACGGTTTGGSSNSNSPGGGSSGSTTVASGTTSGGKTVLTDSRGFALYYLTTEQGGHDGCTNMSGCPGAWPAIPPPSGGSPTAGSGVTGTLAVITASDGTMEVTYNGWPLHTYSGDTAAGQASGEGLMSFGGTWHLLTPSTSSSGGGAGGGNPYHS